MKQRKRPIVTRDFQIRETSTETREDGQIVFRGYASVFNQPAPLYDNIREVIRPGAFKRTLDAGGMGGNIYALWNHNTDKPIASTGTGSLALKEDDTGLFVEIAPNASTAGRDAAENITSGLITKMSFGFEVIQEDMISDPEVKGGLLREIKEVLLWEVSPVTFPFYNGTSIASNELRALGISEEEFFEFIVSRRKDPGDGGPSAHSTEGSGNPQNGEAAPTLGQLRNRLLLIQ